MRQRPPYVSRAQGHELVALTRKNEPVEAKMIDNRLQVTPAVREREVPKAALRHALTAAVIADEPKAVTEAR